MITDALGLAMTGSRVLTPDEVLTRARMLKQKAVADRTMKAMMTPSHPRTRPSRAGCPPQGLSSPEPANLPPNPSLPPGLFKFAYEVNKNTHVPKGTVVKAWWSSDRKCLRFEHCCGLSGSGSGSGSGNDKTDCCREYVIPLTLCARFSDPTGNMVYVPPEIPIVRDPFPEFGYFYGGPTWEGGGSVIGEYPGKDGEWEFQTYIAIVCQPNLTMFFDDGGEEPTEEFMADYDPLEGWFWVFSTWAYPHPFDPMDPDYEDFQVTGTGFRPSVDQFNVNDIVCGPFVLDVDLVRGDLPSDTIHMIVSEETCPQGSGGDGGSETVQTDCCPAPVGLHLQATFSGGTGAFFGVSGSHPLDSIGGEGTVSWNTDPLSEVFFLTLTCPDGSTGPTNFNIHFAYRHGGLDYNYDAYWEFTSTDCESFELVIQVSRSVGDAGDGTLTITITP